MAHLLALLALAAAHLSAPPAAGERPEPLRPAVQEDLVGVWSDVEGDCREVTVLQDDGVFVAPNGGRGNWAVSEGRLTLSGPGGTVAWSIFLEGGDTIVLIEDDGATSRSFRCPGLSRPDRDDQT